MALKISNDCVYCGSCEDECPNLAISPGKDTYMVDPDLCTECVGAHDEPQCMLVCPAECFEPDPEHVETKEQLTKKYEAIHAEG